MRVGILFISVDDCGVDQSFCAYDFCQVAGYCSHVCLECPRYSLCLLYVFYDSMLTIQTASVSVLHGSQLEGRKWLAIYPMLLYYFVLGFTILISN